MDDITQKLRDYYSQTFAEHGANAKGVNWGEEHKAEIRYRAMLAVIPATDDAASVLDVGCGYGGLLLYARKQGLDLRYHGIDVAANMIEHAQANIPDATFACTDIFDPAVSGEYDYVVCNGILTQKLTATDVEMEAYMDRLIARMFALARKGIAFNIMTKRVDFEADNLFYRSPEEILKKALDYSRKVKLDHAYPLYEFTTYIYKDAP